MTRRYKGFIFKTKPWAHQLKALRYLMGKNCGALYTKPGTGKTKVMMDLIVNKGFKRGIIVAPPKACDVWEKQFKIHTDICPNFIHNVRFLSTRKKVQLMNRIAPKGSRSKNQEMAIIIVNYESIWRKDFERTLFRKSGNWDFCICDESHRIKTPSSQCSMCLRRLSKIIPHRYLVTGTPMAENPMDIYAQYRFLDSSIFGTNYSAFKDRYQNVDIQKTAKVGYTVLDRKHPYKNLDELKEKMFSCAFAVESSVKLPKRLNVIRSFVMSKKCQKVYADLNDDGIYLNKKGAAEIKAAISKTLRLQQVCSGFIPVEDPEGQKDVVTIDHQRAEFLEEILSEFDQHEPVVIFCTFRHDFDEIRSVCKKLHRRYTEVSGVEDTMDRWVKGKADIIAVQYRSGSESIDLTRARYCIYYSLNISLALYTQSKKRIHRPGQTRSVVYYHIIADLPNKQSKDRQILAALKLKQDVISYITKNEGGS